MVDLAENREVEGGYTPEWVKLTVVSVAAVVDRNDIPQWQLAVRWPWTNKYDDTIYVYQDKSPKTISPGDEYLVLAQKEYRKTNKSTGEVYDGDLGWMFKWRILEWDADTSRVEAPQPPVAQPERPVQPAPVQEAPPAPTQATRPASQPLTGMDARGLSIIRQVAFKAAVDVVLRLPVDSDPTIMEDYVSRRTDAFMSIILGTHAPIEDGFDESRHAPVEDSEWEA